MTGAIAAVGVGVADMARAVDFYTRVLGGKQTQTFDLPDMDEVVVAFERGAAVVLMCYKAKPGPNCADLPVKLVFNVADPAAVIERIRAEGLEITREPTGFPGMGDTLVALAKDPDGYVVEFLGPPPSKG